MKLSLYIHFPFCKSKCVYCDFCSFAVGKDEIEHYCDMLKREMDLTALEFPDVQISTVFLGGGTPSIVPPKMMQSVMKHMHTVFHVLPNAEFTAEANPGTISDAWLEVMTDAGMNRLSLGVQAKQDRLLLLLGRIHRFKEAEEAVRLADKHGIKNLSTDLMFGLPTQTAGEYYDSIHAVADLGVKHISAYALKVEDGTKLQIMLREGIVSLPDEDETADMMDGGMEVFAKRGFERYEISNYAKQGYESKHNLTYWRQGYYLGLGLNSSSMLPAAGGSAYVRRSNTDAMEEYASRLSAGVLPVSQHLEVSRQEAMFETIMLGLRTTEGVNYHDFEKMHGERLEYVYGEAIEELQRKKFLKPIAEENPNLALNQRGLALQNTALMSFMDKNTDK